MNLKEELLVHLKKESDCMENDVRNMTKAINEDDFKTAYEYVRAIVDHSLTMEDEMMEYKRLKIKEEN